MGTYPTTAALMHRFISSVLKVETICHQYKLGEADGITPWRVHGLEMMDTTNNLKVTRQRLQATIQACPTACVWVHVLQYPVATLLSASTPLSCVLLLPMF